MHLKKIIATGFKSFADKVTIPLDQGINGIVGPNGSGKSNVIDAVRWVMGEQNARNLRGKVATDIIFSGSASRKPQSMAEVTLVFDNTDESAFCPPEYNHEIEISLTRRLYIDGQREYLINKKPCRLKDIVNFFTTTGLGGRSYSMIQQGQVDRILQAKPEDVRIILEEAAGTLVYKNRRDEALKKLSHTAENLSRIEDILSELDRQKQSLKGQMEKAQKWRDLSDELKRDELSLFAHNFIEFNGKVKTFDDEISEQKTLEAEVIAEIAKFEAEQLGLQQALDEADPGLEGLRETVSSIREQLARAESIILSADDKVEACKTRVSALDEEISSENENLSVLEAQMEAAQSELSAAEQQSSELTELIESFQDQVDEVDEQAIVYQNRIDDFEDELNNIDRLFESNKLRCESINREREKNASEVQVCDERLSTLAEDVAEAKMLARTAEENAASRRDGLDAELRKKSELEDQIKTTEIALAEKANERDQIKESYFETRAKFTSLQEMIANANDVAEAFNALKESDPDAGCLSQGLLTDKISFNKNAEELSDRARSAFEKWSERLIVADLGELNSLIRLANQNEIGGLTVSVLSSIEDVDMAALAGWREKTDAISMAEFLKFDDDIAVKGLVDRLFYLPTLQLGSSELDSLPAGIIVFTSQGLQFSARDEFVVGLAGSQTGVLSRKVQLEELASELKTVEGRLAGVQSEFDRLGVEQNESRLSLKELDDHLSSESQDVAELMSELKSCSQLLEHKNELESSTKSQRDGLLEADRKLVEELAEQGQSRIHLADEQERIREELDSIKEEAATIEDRRSEVFRIHEGRKLDLAKADAKKQALQQSYEQTKTQVERFQTGLSRRYDEKAQLEQQISSIREEHQESLSQVEDLMSRREVKEKELTEKRAENAGLIEELRTLDNSLKGCRERFSKIEKKISSKNLESERLRLALEQTLEQAREQYHIDLHHYEFTPIEDFDSTKTSRHVGRLKSRIENLGAINMMAIEEYETLMERHTFIAAQRSEVTNSINLLEDALEEIEDTSREKFLATYHCINEEFAGLFPILFPGGDARLELTMPDDPLNSGVEIIARLPGKKAQRMTLLSGGEKALTAISLIFALLKTKPTPFCFLDEVDAPLDEANVGRYNRVLETLAERFQFIVITHNRRTMEVLDTLFGVTMQEPGVSKVVGVDMKRDIPDHLKKAFKEEEARTGASAH